MWSFRSAAVWMAAAVAGAAAAPLEFRTHELPWAAFGAPYQARVETQVDGRCLDGGVGLILTGGRLAKGLDFRGGEITGIPREFGAFRLRVRAFNACAAAESELVLQVTGRPILRANPEEILVEYQAGSAVPRAKTLLVSATWPGLEYSVRAGEGWLKARPLYGATPVDGSPYAGDVVEVEFAPGKLAPGEYETALLLEASHGAAQVTVPVRLRVLDK